MRHSLVALAVMASAFVFLTSCKGKEDIDGEWDPIKMDRSELRFSAEGGTESVRTTNYSSWWIQYGYESSSWDGTQWNFVNMVYPPEGKFNSLDGGWYSAETGADDVSNTLSVTVSANVSGGSRSAVIEMSVGDAFGKVKIVQD